jgi:DNA primase
MERYKKLLDINSAQGKRQYSDVLLPVVRGLADDVERDHYMNAIARTIDVTLDALEQKLSKISVPEVPPRRRVKITPQRPDKIALENHKLQSNFLSLMLMRPTLREFLDLIESDMLYTEEGRHLLKFLETHPDFDGKNGKVVQNLADYVKIESLLYEELYSGLELNELHYEAARLQARLIEQFIKSEKEKLAQALSTANDADSRVLLEQAKQYDALLNKVKGAAINA